MSQYLVKIVGINGRFTHSCLALFYVRSMLEKKCPAFLSRILQFTINDNYYEMLLRLTVDNPRYIFFSAVIWNSTLIERLVIDLNHSLPGCSIVIGGPQAAVLGDKLPRNSCSIVLGEIEAVEDEFYSDLLSGSPGDCYGTASSLKKAIDFSSPYRDEDFSSHLKNRHVYYESSRGCPFACTYCLSSAEKGLRHKPLAGVKKELQAILKHRPKIIRFIDRTFNDVPERALEIWEFLMAQQSDCLFHFEMAPDRFTEEMFDFLETLECGRFQFEVGIQSTHEPTLAAVNRRIDYSRVHGTVSRLAELGNIHLHVDLILGLPYETRETFAASFRDVFAMGAHYIQMGLLKILPGTPVFRSRDVYGYIWTSEPPYSVMANAWMDHDCLSELYWFSECVEKFMNNRYFVSFWRYLRKCDEDIFAFFSELLTCCLEMGFFQLAPTHELMAGVIDNVISGRRDRGLIRDLLRLDWLRCGHRFLPDCLEIGQKRERPRELKGRLYKILPEEMEGIYTKGSRNYFFRKSYFLPVSEESLREIGFPIEGRPGCICILPERENNLYKLNKILNLT
ncbi:DUF4080 domain-containing protein [Desulfomarina sp.]